MKKKLLIMRKMGMVTDADCKYSAIVPENATLVFTLNGMLRQEAVDDFSKKQYLIH